MVDSTEVFSCGALALGTEDLPILLCGTQLKIYPVLLQEPRGSGLGLVDRRLDYHEG